MKYENLYFNQFNWNFNLYSTEIVGCYGNYNYNCIRQYEYESIMWATTITSLITRTTITKFEVNLNLLS